MRDSGESLRLRRLLRSRLGGPPAAHGWNVRDLHRLLDNHTTSGRRLLT